MTAAAAEIEYTCGCIVGFRKRKTSFIPTIVYLCEIHHDELKENLK
jgi:hypothetical protein